MMQRFLNDPDDVVDETVSGFVKAHGAQVRLHPGNPRVVVSVDAPRAGRVGVVTGGGSGHEPAFLGYVGRGVVDAVAVGEVFSSPTANSFADAIRAADGGAGVAVLVISEELEELFEICDRIQVIHKGHLSPSLDARSTRAEDVGRWMIGAQAEGAVA